MKISANQRRWLILALAITLLGIGPSMRADTGPNHRVSNKHFGVSGGNVNDISRLYCCSGTLGSLVKDSGGTLYILSNNHVLARSDQATTPEDISQPGYVDNNCRVPPIVADFTDAAPLGSNVDAAIAELRGGAMDSTGFIEDIGVPDPTTLTPTVGLAVAKSGRTTGKTTGNIGSINTSVNVQYQKGCGQGKKFVVSYTGQVVINSSTFSAGGDSGSLIVSNNGCPHPVALLFAGSSSTTIGNPVNSVLTQLNLATGLGLTFVGTSCSAASTLPNSPDRQVWPSQEVVQHATRVMETRVASLMALPSVIGVGVGASDEETQEAVIVIYVDTTTGVSPVLPSRIGNVKVKAIFSDPFVAY